MTRAQAEAKLRQTLLAPLDRPVKADLPQTTRSR